ncbi:MAG: tRNA adenosine(34) deaminase TadA [Desulfofustis sp.]|nr:tRNA adenosine(34) deaminase TadA [Desulfofustis sp.]
MDFSPDDISWMEQALHLAEDAAAASEVPVGAVLVKDGLVLGSGGNSPISTHDPTAHAEINAIRQAAEKMKNYRLGGTLYATLEPCLMCMGALIHSRIERLVFGALDPKAGAAVSVDQIGSDRQLNHILQIEGGLLEEQCSRMLREFFKNRR